MAKHMSPKRVPQRPLDPPDGLQHPPDMSDTPLGTNKASTASKCIGAARSRVRRGA